MRALVTGATGFVGRALVSRLERPVVLTRDVDRARSILPGCEAHAWDPLAGPPSPQVFDGIDAVIHLAGDPIAQGRWTAAKKQRLLDSRVLGTRNLVAGIRHCRVRPGGAGVGLGGRLLRFPRRRIAYRIGRAGNDFLSGVCVQWEREAAVGRELGLRVVHTRLGVVLGLGGALGQMLTPFRFGLGGRLGDGKQYFPWVHLDDVVGLLLAGCQRSEMSGVVNLVAPNPVTNLEFTKTLASVLHRPAIFPMPAFMVRVVFGEMSDVLLGSQRVVPGVAERLGWKFGFSQLRPALEAILRPNGR